MQNFNLKEEMGALCFAVATTEDLRNTKGKRPAEKLT